MESFHGRFRDECLNREQLWTLTEARVVIEDFRHRYNHLRPHSKLGYQSPVRFAKQLIPSPTQHRFCYNNIIGKEKYFSHSLSLQSTPGRSDA